MDNTNFIKFDDMSADELAAFNRILEKIFQIRGVDFRQYRPKCLRRRVSVRMNDTNSTSFVGYLSYLEQHPEEYEQLLDRITINVSEFYRNPQTYAAVADTIVPELLARKKERKSRILRVWSAGCATGEEPYSLAILLKEALEKHKSDVVPTIFATDIDKQAMEIARQGIYQERALKELTPRRINKYFDCVDERYQIKPFVADRIKFMRQNMIADPPLQRIDLIFCRNVIIYFSRELQIKVYENFNKALNPGGYLVAGKVETMLGIGDRLFDRINIAERIFRKKDVHAKA